MGELHGFAVRYSCAVVGDQYASRPQLPQLKVAQFSIYRECFLEHDLRARVDAAGTSELDEIGGEVTLLKLWITPRFGSPHLALERQKLTYFV